MKHSFSLQVMEDGVLEHHSYHATYRDAVLVGQRVAGFGSFHVVCPGDRPPTREEQLLIEAPVKRSKKLEALLAL